MQNEFDLAFYGDDEGGVGFFKKLKKAFRKVEKKVNKARRKLHRKILPKKVAKAIVKVEKNKTVRRIGKVAAVAVGAYFAGPAALAYLKSGAGKLGAKFLTKKAVTGVAKRHVLTRVGKKLIPIAKRIAPQAGKFYAQKKLQTYAQRTQLNAANRAALIEANNRNIRIQREIAANPKFREIYNSLLAKGYTPDQALAEWGRSNAYRAITVPQVARTIRPLIQQNLEDNGIPSQYARREAINKSYEMADDEVKKQQSSIDPKLMIASVIGLMALTK